MSTLQDPEVLIQMSALLGMAGFCVWVGSKRSNEKEEDLETETLSWDDAMKFPIFASTALFSVYILFRYFDPEWLSLIMSLYFSLMGMTCVSFAILPLINRFVKPLMKNVSDSIRVVMKDGDSPEVELAFFTRGNVIGLIVGAIVSAAYVYTRHWLTTNFIAMSIVIGAMQLVRIENFKVGALLLAGLFLYDIFWVFGTEVMVSVSKSVDGPIKILFPSDIVTGGISSSRLGMLGLGDIMMPGIMVAMLYRWDVKRGGGDAKSAPTPYFHASFVMYIVGLIITFIVLHVAKHAQPALLYLSPIGILTPLVQAYFRGEVAELLAVGEESPNETEQKEE